MTDFTTLTGINGYRAVFPEVFDGMSDIDVEPIIEAAHSSVLEGWEPTVADMQSLADRSQRDGPSYLTSTEVDGFADDGGTPGRAKEPAPEPDVWRSYFYPGTTAMRNHLGIRDDARLSAVEHVVATGRGLAFARGELAAEGENTSDRLSSIHHMLFAEIYAWAGQPRVVNMMKGTHGFGDHHSMSMYMRQLDRSIDGVAWEDATFEQTVDALADIHTDLNFAHPFRDGNGRVSRLFMNDLAHQHSVELHFNRISCEDWIRASAATFLDPSGIHTDSTPLRQVYRLVASGPDSSRAEGAGQSFRP